MGKSGLVHQWPMLGILATAFLFALRSENPVIPDRPGFAFGLACLVLILGALPTFFDPVPARFGAVRFFVLILLSAASIYLGLRLLKEKVPMKF